MTISGGLAFLSAAFLVGAASSLSLAAAAAAEACMRGGLKGGGSGLGKLDDKLGFRPLARRFGRGHAATRAGAARSMTIRDLPERE